MTKLLGVLLLLSGLALSLLVSEVDTLYRLLIFMLCMADTIIGMFLIMGMFDDE